MCFRDSPHFAFSGVGVLFTCGMWTLECTVPISISDTYCTPRVHLLYQTASAWRHQLARALWREMHALDASQANPAYLHALLSALTLLPAQSPAASPTRLVIAGNSIGTAAPTDPTLNLTGERASAACALRSLRLVRELLFDVDLELFPKGAALREPLLVLVCHVAIIASRFAYTVKVCIFSLIDFLALFFF